jgi:hypothetical protein
LWVDRDVLTTLPRAAPEPWYTTVVLRNGIDDMGECEYVVRVRGVAELGWPRPFRAACAASGSVLDPLAAYSGRCEDTRKSGWLLREC